MNVLNITNTIVAYTITPKIRYSVYYIQSLLFKCKHIFIFDQKNRNIPAKYKLNTYKYMG